MNQINFHILIKTHFFEYNRGFFEVSQKNRDKILSYSSKFLKNHVFSDKTVGWEMKIIQEVFFVGHKTGFVNKYVLE